ncbi:MAG: hypothetical protein SXV54_00400 [Chloroflexota bacterium]|nr:hypothetical protein [Chloroflexota bacterium]
MVRSAWSASRFWIPFAIGLAALCGLLLTLRPVAVASPPQEQQDDDVVLWLMPPDVPPVSGPWPLAVEAHQTGWRARSAALEERLAALKAQGHIVAFEPLPGGVGFAVTAPAGLPPEVRRWPGVARLTPPGDATSEALDAWWRQGLEVASAARSAPLSSQQVTTLTLNLGLHSRMVSGVAPRPEPIALSLTRDGELVASKTATPFPDGSGGYLYAITLHGSYYLHGGGGGGGSYCYPAIEPGDVLQAIQAGETHSLTVPLLTALADQGTATVYGQAPPSTTLEVYFYRYGDSSVAYQQAVTATASGDYQAGLGGLTPVAPRDYGHVFHGNEDGNHVYARYNVPFLQVEIEGSHIDGVVAPCTSVTVTLHDHTGALRETGYGSSSSDGVLYAYLDADTQVGDTFAVTAAGQVVSMTVSALTAHPDLASDTIGGEATPGATVQVHLYQGPLDGEYSSCPPYTDPDYSLSVTAALTGTLAGTYVADFAGLDGVVAGNYGAVYSTDTAGHQVYRCFVVPFLQARLEDYRLRGQVNGSGPVTITVWGSSGIPRDVHFAQAYGIGYFYDYNGGELRLQAGDWVTVTAQDGEETGMTVPLLTANVDQANSIVHGQAPPSSSLRVGLSRAGWYLAGGGPPYYPSYNHTLWVTSTASGIYTADFSSLTTMVSGDYGAVFYVNPEGHEAYLEFSVPAVPAVRVQSGSNYVAGTLSSGSERISVILRDASGQVKAAATTWAHYLATFDVHLYQDGQPAIIEAGDVVEIATGDVLIPTPRPTPRPTPYFTRGDVEIAAEGILVTVAVPTLTVQADRAADVLSGQAPPGAPLEVTWTGGDDWDEGSHIWTVTPTVAGSYSLDLSDQVDLERGDRIEVAWTDENGNKVWVAYNSPRFETELGGRSISVLGPIYAPLTLTLLSTDGASLYTETDTLDSSGQARFYLYDYLGDVPLYLETGQTLVADWPDEVMTVTLPHLTARADPHADTVSGEAPPDARLMVSSYHSYYYSSYWPVTATVTGTYSVDFDGEVDVGSGSSGKVAYLHPDGHRVTLDYAVPHIEVVLGEPYVNGMAPWPGVVTVTLRDTGGGLKGSGVDTDWYSDWFHVYLTDAQQRPVPVTGGDEVVVEVAGSVMTFAVPALTASLERQTGILTGAAPAGAWLRIVLGDGSRQVQAGSDGAYAMDWSDLSPSIGDLGYIHHTGDLGNETSLYFTVPYYSLYLPLVSKDA